MILVPEDKRREYTARGWWGERTVGEYFLDSVARHPERAAVVDAPNRSGILGDAAQRWSYAELLEQTARLVAVMRDQGLERDDIVVMQLPNCVEMHAVYLACAFTGVIVSPVPVQYRAHELKHVLDITRARVVITAARIGKYAAAEQWRELARHAPGLRIWCIGAGEAGKGGDLALAEALLTAPPLGRGELLAPQREGSVSAHDVLTICWTSGTEASPKGVPRNHNEWLIVGTNVLEAAQLPLGAELVIPFPFVNMAGVSTSLAAWLLLEGTLHHHHPFDLAVFIEQLRSQPVQYTVAPPPVLERLLDQPQQLEGVDFDRLKRIGSGGGPLSDRMIAGFGQRYGVEVVNYFGSNEGAALASAPQDVPDPAQRARYFPRMGVPGHRWSLSNSEKIRTRLVDVDSGADVDTPGVAGELRFAGPTIFSQYFNAPDLTRNAFDEQGYYRTGDLFEIAGNSGQFYRFVGRHKDVVIRGGMNISAEEMENLLLSHPDIQEAAVVGKPDPQFGERVCAVVVPRPGQVVTLQDIVDYLKKDCGVAAYKLPESLVLSAGLPRNPVGKILKRALREELRRAGTGGAELRGAA